VDGQRLTKKDEGSDGNLIVIKGKTWRELTPSGKPLFTGAITVDADANPKRITFPTGHLDDNNVIKVRKTVGIYSIHKDVLTICYPDKAGMWMIVLKKR